MNPLNITKEDFEQLITQLSQMGAAIWNQVDQFKQDQQNLIESFQQERQELTDKVNHQIERNQMLQRQLIEEQALLAEGRRNQTALSAELQRLADTVRQYQQESQQVSDLNQNIQALTQEITALQHQLDTAQQEARRQKKMGEENLNCLKLQYENEKNELLELVQSTQDKLAASVNRLERSEMQRREAESRATLAKEEFDSARRQERQELERMKNDLQRANSSVSDLRLQLETATQAVERQIRQAVTEAEARQSRAVSALKAELEEKNQQLNLQSYRLQQIRADHAKEVALLKESYESQINRAYEKARRDFYATQRS